VRLDPVAVSLVALAWALALAAVAALLVLAG
jgi:hypothetical protein